MEQSLPYRSDEEDLIDIEVWACEFDGQPTTALSNTPLAYEIGISLLIMR